MHITGKLLGIVLMVLAGAGFVFAAHLVDVRGKWMVQLQKIKADNQKIADQLVAARLERDQAKAALDRDILRWDRIWTNVAAQFNPPNNNLVANAGAPKEIQQNSPLFAFQLGKNGDSSYVGSFVLTQAQPNLCILRPTFRVREEDVPNWAGASWRFRTMIPSSFATRIAGLEGELLRNDELLAKQENNLKIQNELVEAAKHQREERLAELLGDPKANPPVLGLVAGTTEADDRRNAALVEVDELRREISAANKRVAELIRDNTELAKTLQARSVQGQTAMAEPSR